MTDYDLFCQFEENSITVVDSPKIIKVLGRESFTDLSNLDVEFKIQRN